jgi:hypothetical protein
MSPKWIDFFSNILKHLCIYNLINQILNNNVKIIFLIRMYIILKLKINSDLLRGIYTNVPTYRNAL